MPQEWVRQYETLSRIVNLWLLQKPQQLTEEVEEDAIILPISLNNLKAHSHSSQSLASFKRLNA